jgi:hypothetical protein
MVQIILALASWLWARGGENNDGNSYINYIYDQLNDVINTYFLNSFLTLIKPVEVTGHLDDLLGQ